MQYRFPHHKDASWNSYQRQNERYEIISSLLGSGAIGAEIGVYKGGFGEFLLPHCKKLYLVDPWYRLKPYWGVVEPQNSAVRAFIEILNVYQEEIESGRVQVILDFAVPFMQSLSPQVLDWIYLDASHSYQDTMQELEVAQSVVKPGGYIIGDDYDPDPASKQHGVYLAVNEVLARTGKVLALNKSRQWAFRI
jgi:hypothetical protein